jgi:hypothetical protein
MWKKFLRTFLGRKDGATTEPGVPSLLAQAMTLIQQKNELLSSLMAIIKRYEKLESERQSAPINGTDASGPRFACNPDGVILLRKSWQAAYDWNWN